MWKMADEENPWVKKWVAIAKKAPTKKMEKQVAEWTQAIEDYEKIIDTLKLKRVIFNNELFGRKEKKRKEKE